MSRAGVERQDVSTGAPAFAEAHAAWWRIGLLSFGGPAGQIALMHRVLVEEKKWLSERQFLNALNFCMLLPGPEAMQLATYAGWLLHGVRGGLAAGIAFVVPGAVVIFALALAYAAFGDLAWVEAVFIGIKAAVLVIVVQALMKVAGRALRRSVHWAIAAMAFFGLFFLGVPFPLVIFGAALAGFVLLRGDAARMADGADVGIVAGVGSVRLSDTARTVAGGLAIWLGPLVVLVGALGPDHVLSEAAIFFSKLAVVTFGGAYAVLAYMAQEVVEGFRWLTAGEMLDSLGLAETTPGPLILVTQFVGTLAAARDAGGLSFPMAIAGSLVTLWATFAPCFLWIFAGAPYIERAGRAVWLSAALSGVTAAVVGVIANLSLWFALQVLFGDVTRVAFGPFQAWLPTLATLDPAALALTGIAAALLLWRGVGVMGTLAACAALAGVVSAVTG
ncbi:MAG: chromate efflux transporter [Pseudomonadota bacterium]